MKSKKRVVARLIKFYGPKQRLIPVHVHANPLADGSTSYTIRFRAPHPHTITRRNPKHLVDYANRLGYHILWSTIPGVEGDSTFKWITEGP